MNDFAPLLPGSFYHIYNRGNNRENIFVDQDNYRFFLEKYFKHTGEVVDTYAYCLLKNHFHLLVQVKDSVACGRIKPFRSQSEPQVKQDLKGLEAEQIPEFA